MARAVRFLPFVVVALVVAAVAGGPSVLSRPAAGPAAQPIPWVKHGFKDGPVGISQSGQGEIARLSLPGGKYAITAKVWLGNGGTSRVVLCTLGVGAEYDTTKVTVPGPGDTEVVLNMTGRLAAPGFVSLGCGDLGMGGGLVANFIKITAIRAGTLRVVEMK